MIYTKVVFRGRLIEVEIDGYDKNEGALIGGAVYLDEDEGRLTEEDVKKLLNLYQAQLDQLAFENTADAALEYFQGDRTDEPF